MTYISLSSNFTSYTIHYFMDLYACNIWANVLADIVSDPILTEGPCDLYFIIHEF